MKYSLPEYSPHNNPDEQDSNISIKGSIKAASRKGIPNYTTSLPNNSTGYYYKPAINPYYSDMAYHTTENYSNVANLQAKPRTTTPVASDSTVPFAQLPPGQNTQTPGTPTTPGTTPNGPTPTPRTTPPTSPSVPRVPTPTTPGTTTPSTPRTTTPGSTPTTPGMTTPSTPGNTTPPRTTTPGTTTPSTPGMTTPPRTTTPGTTTPSTPGNITTPPRTTTPGTTTPSTPGNMPTPPRTTTPGTTTPSTPGNMPTPPRTTTPGTTTPSTPGNMPTPPRTTTPGTTTPSTPGMTTPGTTTPGTTTPSTPGNITTPPRTTPGTTTPSTPGMTTPGTTTPGNTTPGVPLTQGWDYTTDYQFSDSTPSYYQDYYSDYSDSNRSDYDYSSYPTFGNTGLYVTDNTTYRIPMGVPMMPLYGYDNCEDADKDLSYMKQMYPQVAKKLLVDIEDECDKLEYDGSCMFDEYPDRVTLERIVDRIYEKYKYMEEEDVSAENISTTYSCNNSEAKSVKPNQYDRDWDYRRDRYDRRRPRPRWLRDLIEVLLFNEILNRRRRYRGRRRWF